mmetsp:Transcript_2310/g.4623  ORF Transcript_2310/g.4623 Transcript_2310/m.4623 type:complete len:91 (+) Transcript_2310:578-850(+)
MQLSMHNLPTIHFLFRTVHAREEVKREEQQESLMFLIPIPRARSRASLLNSQEERKDQDMERHHAQQRTLRTTTEAANATPHDRRTTHGR